MPLDSITTDMSGESGVLIRNNGNSNIWIDKSDSVAFLTVVKLPSRMQSLSQRMEDSRLAIKATTLKVMKEELGYKSPLTKKARERNTRPRPKQSHAFAAESPFAHPESHLLGGALKSIPTKRLPKVSWFGGTKPVEEANLWFTKHADDVGPDSDKERECELPQIGTVAVKGEVARVNVEYYQRRAVRRHGKD